MSDIQILLDYHATSKQGDNDLRFEMPNDIFRQITETPLEFSTKSMISGSFVYS